MHCVQILGVFWPHIEVSKCAKSIAIDSFIWKFWNIPENVLKIEISTSGSKKKKVFDFVYLKKDKYSNNC